MISTVIPGNGHSMDRASALRSLASLTRKNHNTMKPVDDSGYVPISDYFGELTFGLGEMREKLPKEFYNNLLAALDHGKKLGKETTDAVAQVVKDWAVSQGVTHFCHWFQPMTGSTAEKHDAFISIQHSHHSELKVIERFSGSQLIQGEPDASSFPSGGMRTTFEARGYTAWDPSCPLFLVEGEKHKTLCVPSIFFGYHGQALDLKTPLLRSSQALSKEACSFLKLLGDVDVKRVTATLGAEQEYFLIDRHFAALRPDLILTGRTLLGAPAAVGQRLEDHYFGSIPTRVMAFMEDLETELYRLGIPVKTRHNEVAPSQFELAPIFENANVAADHNSLTMETMKRIATRHGFMCLLQEKPFADINGSGKHCNWSIGNDKGENLLDPGKTPHQNLRFLAIITVVLKAIHEHADMLRVSAASPGNDHRLGGNEAPPSIVSVFLGSLLNRILEGVSQGKAEAGTETGLLDLGIAEIPNISQDYTDRNRTSPFAFTGTKFEFRAVGSAASVAVPTTIINAAVADALVKASERLKVHLGETDNRDEAVMHLIKELYEENKAIIFEGDNYSEAWVKEAKKRGLPNLASTPDALKTFQKPDAVQFLIDQSVLSADELKSRHNVGLERYVNTVEIELTVMNEMVMEYVVPALESQLIRSHGALKDIGKSSAKKAQSKRTEQLETILEAILENRTHLGESLAKLSETTRDEEKASLILKEALPIADKLRKACDTAELSVADELWRLPKYREMLFANRIS